MNEHFGDGRLEELKLLSEIDRHGEYEVTPGAGPVRHLVAYLVQQRFVNDLDPHPATINAAQQAGLPGESQLERVLQANFVNNLHRVLQGSTTKLRLSHHGRVRLSELKQALRTGREREPFGILWDVRHWQQDLQVAVLDAREDSPLAVAYLDMNGLKQINDTHSHDAGDLALRTYFQAVNAVLGDGGQAYRLSGGADEVLIALPNCNEEGALRALPLACIKLMDERLWPMDQNALLSIAAGLVVTTDPKAEPKQLQVAADEEQRKAKQRSRETTPRPSVIAIKGQKDLIVLEHDLSKAAFNIVGSYFQKIGNEEGIRFKITNTSKDTMAPFKVVIFHPKAGSWAIFPSEKSGPLLQDQERDFSCPILKDGHVQRWVPKLSHTINGEPLSPADDADFEFRVVLEDSDDKVLYRNKRMGRRLAAMIKAVWAGTKLGSITFHDWMDLKNTLPDK